MYSSKGDIVEGFTCPKCRRRRIVYNGNYFCEGMDEGCNWALGERNTPFSKKLVAAYLKQIGRD